MPSTPPAWTKQSTSSSLLACQPGPTFNLGHSYTFDGPATIRQVVGRYKTDAGVFFTSPRAEYLADLIGLEASALWREARGLERETRPLERNLDAA